MGSEGICKFCTLYRTSWKDRKGFVFYDDGKNDEGIGFGIPSNTPVTYGHFVFIHKPKVIPTDNPDNPKLIHVARIDQLADQEGYAAAVRRAFLEVQEICEKDPKRIFSFYDGLTKYSKVISSSLYSSKEIVKIAKQMLRHPHRRETPLGYIELVVNYLINSPGAHGYTEVIPLYKGDKAEEVMELIKDQMATTKDTSGVQKPHMELEVDPNTSYLMLKKDRRRVMGALREYFSLEGRVKSITQELVIQGIPTSETPESPGSETPNQ